MKYEILIQKDEDIAFRLCVTVCPYDQTKKVGSIGCLECLFFESKNQKELIVICKKEK